MYRFLLSVLLVYWIILLYYYFRIQCVVLIQTEIIKYILNVLKCYLWCRGQRFTETAITLTVRPSPSVLPEPGATSEQARDSSGVWTA